MSNTDPAGWNEAWRYLVAGLGAALGTYRVLSHILEQATFELDLCRRSEKKRARRNAWYGSVSGLQNLPSGYQDLGSSSSLNTESMSLLALKSDYRLRTAATELLYENAMRPEMLALIVKATSDDTDSEMRLRAITLIRQIAQTTSRRRAKLIKAGAIDALVGGLHERDDHELALRSGCALMELLNVRDTKLAKRYRRKAASCGLLEVVYDILESLSKEK
ncbi:hypothetical protein GGF42_005316, partial [Coemansia sp. RSA 2424]